MMIGVLNTMTVISLSEDYSLHHFPQYFKVRISKRCSFLEETQKCLASFYALAKKFTRYGSAKVLKCSIARTLMYNS